MSQFFNASKFVITSATSSTINSGGRQVTKNESDKKTTKDSSKKQSANAPKDFETALQNIDNRFKNNINMEAYNA